MEINLVKKMILSIFRKNITISLILSVAFHAALAAAIYYIEFTPEETDEPSVVKVRIVYKEDKPPEQEEILPKGKGDSRKKSRGFYWGLGFDPTYVDVRSNEVKVKKIDETYCGFDSGLRNGDIIEAIDAQPISHINDIRGDGPRKMILNVIRNDKRMLIQTERCKVYY